MAAVVGLLVILLLGVFVFRRLTLPLHRLADRLRTYRPGAAMHPAGGSDAAAAKGDEVTAIGAAFDEMTRRNEAQAARELQQGNAHREMMASVAHDLRTPLTALHGHLEALRVDTPGQVERQGCVLAAPPVTLAGAPPGGTRLCLALPLAQ